MTAVSYLRPCKHFSNTTDDSVALCTEDITSCMDSSRKRVIKALNISIVFAHLKNLADNQSDAIPKSCELELGMPDSTAMQSIFFHVHFFNQTCTQHNHVLLSSDRGYYYQEMHYIFPSLLWAGCEPGYDPLPVFVSRKQPLFVVIHLNDVSADYSLRFDVVARRFEEREPGIELVALSSDNGEYKDT